MEISKPGAYKISMDEYQGDPCPVPSLSRGVIQDLIYHSPAHAWFNHPRLNPAYQRDEGNGKFDPGTAAHALLLEGVDNIAVIEADDWRTKAAKEARDNARLVGKTPLLKHQYEAAKAMVFVANDAILNCKELGITDLRTDGDSELSWFWKEGETWCRSRTDWISHDFSLILDLKFTDNSANPYDLSKHILSMGYDLQSSFYRRGVKAIKKTEPKFVFVFVEKFEPYLCSFVSLPPDFDKLAEEKCQFGIGLWQECLRRNDWPGYPNRICYLDLPAWAMASWEQKASEVSL